VSFHDARPSEVKFTAIWQAIQKNENNYKALFRKSKALGELGYFEKAEKLLEELAKKDPESTFSLSCFFFAFAHTIGNRCVELSC